MLLSVLGWSAPRLCHQSLSHLHLQSLSRGERTGSRVLYCVWSYVSGQTYKVAYTSPPSLFTAMDSVLLMEGQLQGRYCRHENPDRLSISTTALKVGRYAPLPDHIATPASLSLASIPYGVVLAFHGMAPLSSACRIAKSNDVLRITVSRALLVLCIPQYAYSPGPQVSSITCVGRK